jgi:hypothetical protein
MAYDDSLAMRSVAVPVRVEHMQERRPTAPPIVPLRPAFAYRSMFELHSLIDDLFRFFEEDLFFDWPPLRR